MRELVTKKHLEQMYLKQLERYPEIKQGDVITVPWLQGKQVVGKPVKSTD